MDISKVEKIDSILIVGCGNSKLNNELQKKGFKNIFNIDISQICIEKMKKSSDKQKFISEWIVCDGSQLPFQNNSFDYCIEKGTIDALQCGDDQSLSKAIMKEMIRVTKNKLFFISHGNAFKRQFLFENLNCNVQYTKQALSDEADLINCMRSSFPDKTLKEIMQDKDCFVKALMQCNLKRSKRIKIKKISSNNIKKFRIFQIRFFRQISIIN